MNKPLERTHVVLFETPEHLQLEIFEGITFTHREIDIISCILNGRSAKKIAQLLAISPKTVETHIRNIMLKLGCNSQDNIIDFIEKTNKYVAFKDHYVNLLSNHFFELELNKVSTLISNQPLKCTLVYNSEDAELVSFIQRLQDHLLIAGITTVIINSTNINTHLNEKIVSSSNDCIIHFLILESNEIFQIDKFTNEYFMKSSINAFLTYYCISGSKINKAELGYTEYIDLTIRGNYYLFFFEFLGRLVPYIDSNNIIQELKKHNRSFINHQNVLEFKKEQLKKDMKPIESIPTSKNLKSKINWLLPISIFAASCFLGLLCYDYLHYDHKEKSVENKLSNQDNVAIGISSAQPGFEKEEQFQWNIPPQHHQFVGRHELLKKMHEELHPQTADLKNDNVSPVIRVCAGLGGVGKTQLALQYAYHTEYPYTLKAWFIAERPDQLKRQYIEFAKYLGFKENNPTFKTANYYLKTWFLNHPNWLIVFDNVEDYDSIAEFLPEGKGSIIITTRHRDWPNTFKIFDVNEMTETESIDLLASLVQHDISNNESNKAKELVNTLGNLPLALAQAGAYMNQNSITVPEYLDLYKQHAKELLIDNTLPKGTNSLPVEITWKINLDAIFKEDKHQKKSGLALHLLTACAYMAPEKISRNLLLTWLRETEPNLSSPELKLPKIIGQLWRYSLVAKDDNGDITIHRLVQTVIRHQHKSCSEQSCHYFPALTQDWYSRLFKSVHTEFNRQSGPLEDEIRQRDLLPHLQSLVLNYESLWPNTNKINYLGEILSDIGSIFFYQMFNPGTAKTYYEQGLTLQEKFYGKTHIEVINTLRHLGSVYRKMGDYKKAKEIFEQVLVLHEGQYGNHHPEVASDLMNLGYAQRLFGNYKIAEELLQRALNIQENYYGKNHPTVALTQEALGIVYYKMENYQKAKELFDKSFEIIKIHYGMDHPKTAYLLRDLGFVVVMLGDYKEAINLLEKALKIQNQYCEDDNPTVAFTLRDLGYAYGVGSRYKQALNLLDRALKIQENTYGKDHPEVAFTLKNIGYVYDKTHKYSEAKLILERALMIQEQFYGKEHPETLMTLKSLELVSQK